MKRLYLIRHGEVEGSDGKAVGHLDLPLSPYGTKRIEALTASWRGPAPDRLFTSDLRRAAESAQILAAHFGVAPIAEPRLREISFGAWEGLSWDEIHRRDGRHLAAWGERWWELAPPGGETFNDLLRRVLTWFNELEEGEVVAAVAHGGSLRALFTALLDLPREEIFNLRLDHSHVSALLLEGESYVPLFVNRARFF
jgi:broad specificity phosphatase PhoE